jgi:hypothetical protein
LNIFLWSSATSLVSKWINENAHSFCLHFYLIFSLVNDISAGILCYRRQFCIPAAFYILIITYIGIQFLISFQSCFLLILYFRGRHINSLIRLCFPRFISLLLKWVSVLRPGIKNALGSLPGGTTTLQLPNVRYCLTFFQSYF